MLSRYIINVQDIRKQGIYPEDFFLLLSLYHRGENKIVYDDSMKNLTDTPYSGYCDGFIYLTNVSEFEKVIKKINKDSGKESISDEYIVLLSSKLKDLYPTGLKTGTNQYWRGNRSIVATKLKKFFDKYGYIEEDTILEATDKYIKSYGNNRTLMRTLPYFIEKDGESDLLTRIENIDDESVVSNNSNNTLFSMDNTNLCVEEVL